MFFLVGVSIKLCKYSKTIIFQDFASHFVSLHTKYFSKVSKMFVGNLTETRSEKVGPKLYASCAGCREPCNGPFQRLGSFSNDDGDGNENLKTAIGLLSKTIICTCITLFCTFLCRCCTTTTWKCLISRFMEEVNKRRRNFLSFFINLSVVPKKSMAYDPRQSSWFEF